MIENRHFVHYVLLNKLQNRHYAHTTAILLPSVLGFLLLNQCSNILALCPTTYLAYIICPVPDFVQNNMNYEYKIFYRLQPLHCCTRR